MRKRMLLSGALLVLFAYPAAAQTWKETKSVEGKFKVSLPGAAKYQYQDLKTDVGKIRQHIFAVETDGGKFAYLAFYNDYPEDHVRRTGAETMLDNARAGALGQLQNNKVVKESKIKLAGHAGREMHFTGVVQGMNVHASWRMYLVNNRLYQVGVVGIGEAASAESIRKCFDSFSLLEK
jgi:hypothetical protein